MGGNRYYKMRPKLTEDAKRFAVTKLACDITASQIVRDIKEKFNIDISSVRVGNLVKTKRFGELYEIVRNKYLTGMADLSDIELYSKRKRLEQITKMNNKVMTIVEKLAERADKSATKYDLVLLRELRWFVETNLKVLRQAQMESEETKEAGKGRGNQGVSLLQVIGKQNMLVTDKKPKEIEKGK